MTSVFGFWTSGAGLHGSQFPAVSQDAWRAFDPDFKVFDDEAVLKALSRWSRQIRDLYLDIRIPACRSDIARLALLNMFGGTYVDAHTVPGDLRDLREYLNLVARHDLVIAQFDAHESPMPYNRIFNSPISARAGASVLTDLLRRGLANLIYQRDVERERGEINLMYTIFDLTGPNMIRDKIVDYSRAPIKLLPHYEKSVHIVDLKKYGDGPFQLYRHGDYRKGGNHWSLREKSESLFFSTGLSGK